MGCSFIISSLTAFMANLDLMFLHIQNGLPFQPAKHYRLNRQTLFAFSFGIYSISSRAISLTFFRVLLFSCPLTRTQFGDSRSHSFFCRVFLQLMKLLRFTYRVEFPDIALRLLLEVHLLLNFFKA